MDDLVRWLDEQLTEDERIVRAATPGPWVANKHEYGAEVYTEGGEGVALDHDAGGVGWDDADFIAEHDPTRALREIDAKRRLLEWLEQKNQWALDNNLWSWDDEEALRLLALPYAARPGYKESWRP
ncbi:DUF6221 family protein [Streptomyces viridosporus]|nr:DUF6221 family protein [Streptomyces viridosporus]